MTLPVPKIVAEGIITSQVRSAPLGFVSFFANACRQATGDQRGGEEGDQGGPILRIGMVKVPTGVEEIIEGQHAA